MQALTRALGCRASTAVRLLPLEPTVWKATGSALPAASTQQSRGMAGGHHPNVVTYEGLALHKPAKWQVYWGTGMSALMWFWILYRFYHDHETFLYGHAVHFDGEQGQHSDAKHH